LQKWLQNKKEFAERFRKCKRRMKQQGGKCLVEIYREKWNKLKWISLISRLTEQTIQKAEGNVLTRPLLESEKSMREQDLDDERKGETAKDYTNEIPKLLKNI
jgi:hypothetical protein